MGKDLSADIATTGGLTLSVSLVLTGEQLHSLTPRQAGQLIEAIVGLRKLCDLPQRLNECERLLGDLALERKKYDELLRRVEAQADEPEST